MDYLNKAISVRVQYNIIYISLGREFRDGGWDYHFGSVQEILRNSDSVVSIQ